MLDNTLDISVGIATGYSYSLQMQNFPFLFTVHRSPENHRDFYSASVESDLPGDVKLTTHLYLVSKSRMLERYLHSSIRLLA
jgi:hypothetical protein